MVHSRQKTQKPTLMFCEFRSASPPVQYLSENFVFILLYKNPCWRKASSNPADMASLSLRV